MYRVITSPPTTTLLLIIKIKIITLTIIIITNVLNYGNYYAVLKSDVPSKPHVGGFLWPRSAAESVINVTSLVVPKIFVKIFSRIHMFTIITIILDMMEC